MPPSKLDLLIETVNTLSFDALIAEQTKLKTARTIRMSKIKQDLEIISAVQDEFVLKKLDKDVVDYEDSKEPHMFICNFILDHEKIKTDPTRL